MFLLFGYFMLFCALLMLMAGGWRTWREHTVDSRWVESQAYVKECRLETDQPFESGTIYSLRCLLGYTFASRPYEFKLRTTIDRSLQGRSKIENWVADHPPGTMLPVKVDPADPTAIAVKSELPVNQFRTAREAWLTVIAFVVGGLLLILIGRRLLARQNAGRPSPTSPVPSMSHSGSSSPTP